MTKKDLSLFCGGLAGLLGIVILLGWQFDIVLFKSVFSKLPATMPLTAVFLFLCGMSLIFLQNTYESFLPRKRFLSQCTAWGTTFLSAYIFSEYLFCRLPELEGLLFRETVCRSGESLPGRPSPHTALSTLFFCGALLLSSARSPSKRRFALVPMAGTFVIVWMVLFGYAATVNPFYILPTHPQIGMGLWTAIGLVILCIGMFYLHADERFASMMFSHSSGSMVIKVLLPVALGAPVLLSWMIISLPFCKENVFFAISTVMAVTSLLFSTLVLWVGYLIHRHEIERNALAKQREDLLAELEKTLCDLKNLKTGFLTMCAWTHKVLDKGQWVTIEEFLNQHFGLTISHGISDESLLLDDLPSPTTNHPPPFNETEKTSQP